MNSELDKFLENHEDYYVYWWELLWLFKKEDIDFYSIKEYINDEGFCVYRVMPGTAKVLSNLKSIIDYYETGFALWEIADLYEVATSSLGGVLSQIIELRPNWNEFAAKSLERYQVKAEENLLKYRSSEKYIGLCNIIESLQNRFLRLYPLRCSCCNKIIDWKTLTEWKEFFRNSQIPPHCGNNHCIGFLIHLNKGFPNDLFKRAKLLRYYHSEEFGKQILEEIKNENLSLGEVASKYGFTWKFIRYHLNWVFDMDESLFIGRNRRVYSNKINSGEIYNTFKDPVWQSQYGSRAEYTSQFGTNGWYRSHKMNEDYHFRSSWEEQAYRILDDNIRVSRFYVECLVIPYEFEGNSKGYIPDILVILFSGRKILIEIKPSELVDDAINVAKFKYATDYCRDHDMEFKVITEENWNELCELGQKE